LPLLVVALLRATRWTAAAQPDSTATTIGLIVGVGVGLCLGAAQLLSERPMLNWTLVQPHRFTAPGWYHAAFVIVTLAVILALTGRLIGRAASYSWLPFAATITYCFTGFVLLQLADTFGPTSVGAVRQLDLTGIAKAAGATALLLIGLWFLRPRAAANTPSRYRHWILVTLASAAGVALTLLCIDWHPVLGLTTAAIFAAIVVTVDHRIVGTHRTVVRSG